MLTKIKLIALIIFSISISSCEDAFFEEDIASTDPFENFEYLWKECDEKYSFFELKNIDWDAVKVKYSDKLYNGMSEDSLFNVLGSMLNELRDDHTNLISYFNISAYKGDLNAQDNFDWRIVVDNYITKNYYRTGPFNHNFLDNGKIGYIRFPEFTGTVSQKNLDFILEKYKDTQGLIFDLRENGGGDAGDIFRLLSRFVETKTLLYYSRIKAGPEHNDFSEAEPTYLEPYDGIRYKKKVIFLVDRGTYSAGSFTSLATKVLDNITLIGDTTGGGLGLPNGGQLPNGWRYRFSITQALTLDQKPDYENGVPPDIQVSFDWSNLSRDKILDRAILELQ